MDLSDALSSWPAAGGNQSGGGGAWPGNTNNPTWPGNPSQPPANPTWPGGPSPGGGVWPGGNQPGGNQPGWPSPATQPAGGWPSPAPGPGPGPAPGPGGWPSPAPGPGPGPGPAPGPGGWPSPAPGPGPGHGPAPGPGGWPSPAPGPGPGHGPAPSFPSAPHQSLAVPYHLTLPSGAYNNLLITIAGTVKPNAKKITVDVFASDDLAFHFNPRFNEEGKKVIVRNSCIGKKWGKEERELTRFPFAPGQPFEMKLLCTNREFKVAVNNSHLLDFKHRITNLRSINRLNIYCDLTLSKVNMETAP